MKALLHSGLGLALGLLAARAGADETQWRASTRSKADVVPAAVSASPVRLGTPRSAEDGVLPPHIVRAKADGEDPLPLPLGPSLKIGDPKGAPPRTPAPKAKGEFVPTMPRPIVTPSEMGVAYPADSCCDTGCASPCGPCAPLHGWLKERWNFHGGMFGSGNSLCGDSLCDPCCPQRPTMWLNAAYLLWSVKGQDTPPLVVANPNAAPILGNLGTSVVLGGDNLENNWRSGGRFQFGFWLPNDQWGFDFGYFYLGDRVESFKLGSNGVPQIGRPFVNAANGLPFTELVAGGGVVGGIQVDNAFRMWGLDAHLRKKVSCSPLGWCDAFVGYRHLYLDEKLSITETPTLAGTSFIVNDRFGTQNTFNGIDFGFQCERRIAEHWFVQVNARIALGNINQIVDISGDTTRSVAGGATTTAVGGFAALPSNIGKFQQNRLGVIPEVGVKVGFDVTQNLRVFAGYDVLWINSVVRPGEQIDPVINLGQVPFHGAPNTGQARPAVLFNRSDFWAQGANFGLELRY